uniref:NADH-ubiquinone oxidoreductase chain 2 n=1 Tax=Eubasilissa sinensis TaxID=2904901 RepID=A0A9E8LNU8_9NEOP|nr:NADH dehydrogenase subunit 2 [Eubasilissa sinensis]UZZ43922.1 NADH dehydrogenase subunit 2 [Eubasilissa sinensis]
MSTNYNYTKLMFFFTMMMSSLFSISSLSFINMWMGMEVNLISFIPLMMNNSNSLSSESMMKYFLIQSLSSANFLLSSIILISMNKWFSYFNWLNFFIFFIMNISLLMKMGAAPLHFWFPKTMKGLSWMNCLILSTWQKIIPMIILSYCYLMMVLTLFILLSVILGSLMGFNQTSLQMILAYSSISHIGWMLTTMMINMNMWFLYFMTYSFLTSILMMMFNFMKIFHLIQIFSSKPSMYINYFIFLNLLSLGGLPPFLGFLPKWLTINFLILNKFYFMNFILIMSSLINLFFYLRIMYSFLMMNYHETKFNKIFINKINLMIIMSFLSLFGLILFTLILYL